MIQRSELPCFYSSFIQNLSKPGKYIFSRWIPECGKVLLDSKQHWTHLIPTNEGDSAALIQKFFSCVAALMSIQLRSLVLNSLKDFLDFLKMYQVSYSCSYLDPSYTIPIIIRATTNFGIARCILYLKL